MPARSNYLFVQGVLQKATVRAKIGGVADRMAREARAIAAQEGVAVPVTRVDGIRPKGRPFARVQIPAVHEFGDSGHKRLRLLGRLTRP